MIVKILAGFNTNDETDIYSSPLRSLKYIRQKNPNRIVIAHLNINSIRNKIDQLRDFIKDTVDILLVSETKLCASFPEGQFFIDGFSHPYRLDRSDKGGGLILYIRDHIPSRLLNIIDRVKSLII